MDDLATSKAVTINVRRNAEYLLADDSVCPPLPGLEVAVECLADYTMLGFSLFKDALSVDAKCSAVEPEALRICLAALIRWTVAHADEIKELSSCSTRNL